MQQPEGMEDENIQHNIIITSQKVSHQTAYCQYIIHKDELMSIPFSGQTHNEENQFAELVNEFTSQNYGTCQFLQL